eukprot:1520645-Prymnesium_polylepis.1
MHGRPYPQRRSPQASTTIPRSVPAVLFKLSLFVLIGETWATPAPPLSPSPAPPPAPPTMVLTMLPRIAA